MKLTEEERGLYDAIVAGILAEHPDDGADEEAAKAASRRALAAIRVRREDVESAS